ncbi:polysaccharide deacetylase family protein [Amphritea sp. HPY]|uniref:polysaccharide deacetylase family protein n=1 Tax=Amphritea sp. HPY TaxID=3421652 RepID=UPI003D7DFBAF
MKKLLVITSARNGLLETLGAALRRSFTRGVVVEASVALWKQYLSEDRSFVLVVADPRPEWGELIRATIDKAGSKVIIFGAVPDNLLGILNVQTFPYFNGDEVSLFASLPAETNNYSESPAAVFYNTDNELGAKSPIQIRRCERFDFMAEWNNLGFGAIRADQSIWAVSSKVTIPQENIVAEVRVGSRSITSYAGLWSIAGSCLLWINRPVGSVDSQEWLVVEEFVSSYAFESAICLPVISEIPPGYDACVTMRLDCDEDIISAKQLYELYKDKSVPFSLAVHASVLEDESHHSFLKEFVSEGGSVLTHSWSHPVNWGGSYEEAISQVNRSVESIKSVLGEKGSVKYAVSPFHQNPSYAVQGMANAGLTGFVGGIICNDPEYLIARGGEVPFAPHGFISHSQQCMLHGECMLTGEDPLEVFKESFDIAKRGKSLFGFLDHPFSPRYAYGWSSEEDRCEAHSQFIDYINSTGKVLFLTEDQAMDWIALKDSVELTLDGNGYISAVWTPRLVENRLPEVRYQNQAYSLGELEKFMDEVVAGG